MWCGKLDCRPLANRPAWRVIPGGWCEPVYFAREAYGRKLVPQPVVDGVAQGMIAFYGTYTVNDGVLTTRIEGSSHPNLIGGEQKRIR